MAQISIILLAFVSYISRSLAQLYDTRFTGVSWDNEEWRLLNTNFDPGHYQSRLSLANGYLGINVASAGPFFEYDVPVNGDDINGWPLFDRRQAFATIAGFWNSQPQTNGSNFPWLYQYGGESAISGIPHWAGLLVSVNGSLLNASVDTSAISNFSSILDMKSGLMTWKYNWLPAHSAIIEVEYKMFVHRLHLNQAAVQLTLTAATDTNITVIDVLNGDCALRTNSVATSFDKSNAMIYSAVSPSGLPDIKAFTYSVLTSNATSFLTSLSQSISGDYLGTNQSSIAQSADGILPENQAVVFTKFIGSASNDVFTDAQTIARQAAISGAQQGWKRLLETHKAEWIVSMPRDSIDNYTVPDVGLPEDLNIIELQITAVTNPFHIIQNTITDNAYQLLGSNPGLRNNSIAVGGLASDSYAGQVFWDADVWMAPGLVVSNPQAVAQIVNYRASGLAQAQENINFAFTSSQNATGKFSQGGAVFPWTDARYHNCTPTGPCFDYEYHLNGEIGLSFYNYLISTGDFEYFRQNLYPTFESIAWFYAELLSLNSTTRLYDLYNATDPDEYANFVNNPGYTMVLIKTHLERANNLRQRFGMEPNSTWTDRAAKINIPVENNAGIILEYTGMNGSISVKQADVVLVDDFLDYPNNYSLSNLDYYAGKQSPDGPGMTYGVFGIVANKVALSGCSAYTYDLYSSQPYIRGPWFQYSEQLVDDYNLNGGTHPAYPFLTGMGGAHRVAVFGYLGYRILIDSFDITPSLPPQIPYLKYRTIYWQGHPISAWSNLTHTVLSRNYSLPALDGANSTFTSGPIPVTMNNAADIPQFLFPNGSLALSNRMIGLNATFEGNIAQCKPSNSSQSYVPGQLPIAAIDGAISTKWQPSVSNITASLVVDLGNISVGISINGFAFDWAQHPPTTWQVDFSNSSMFFRNQYMTIFNSTQVNISDPYDPVNAAAIVPYSSNVTNVTLDTPVGALRYARLSILGNQGDEADIGATVAEFAILRVGGDNVVSNEVVHQNPELRL